MSQTTLIHDAVELIVSDDRLAASIVIDSAAAPYGIDPAELLTILESAGIVSVPLDHLKTLATGKGRITARTPLTVIRGTAPRPGHEARLELLGTPGLEAMVVPGTPLATLRPGDDGTPGRDVFNRPIPAYRREDPFTLGTGIRLDEDHVVRSSAAGRLVMLPDNTLAVLSTCCIRGDLTAQEVSAADGPCEATAPGRFAGDVEIEGSVRDAVRLEIAGSLRVGAAVDADRIQVGQDLCSSGGILGGGLGARRGHYITGRDLRARFATGAHLDIARDLTLEADLMHCHVVCRGTVRVGERIHGCSVHATGGVHCQSATSSAQHPTVLEAGSDPLLRDHAEKTLAALHGDFQRVEHARLTISPLLSRMESLTPAQRQQAVRLIRDTRNLEQHIAFTTLPLRERFADYKSRAIHEIHIADTLQAGVIVRFPGLETTIPTSFRGPLKVIPDRTPGEPRVHVVDLRSHTSHALPARLLPDPILFQLTKVMQKIA